MNDSSTVEGKMKESLKDTFIFTEEVDNLTKLLNSFDEMEEKTRIFN